MDPQSYVTTLHATEAQLAAAAEHRRQAAERPAQQHLHRHRRFGVALRRAR
ncbi:hypothetical protein [Xylanimonas sp. McL0601]|uniref:hypothetical protein n=1 Tax=Xylanimonas sp. McL0601 TaxID=3414739 RepID=UPI003CED2180